MHILPNPLQHWINYFYGYGSWEAPFWFVSLEEGGGDLPEEVAEKFNYFSEKHGAATQATLCDIRDLYQRSTFHQEGSKTSEYTNLYEFRFGDKARLNGVWKNLIAFEHGYEQIPLPDMLDYQKNVFASSAAKREALIKFFPLPSANHHAWYYSWLDLSNFDYLRSRLHYQEYLYPIRFQSILNNIRQHKPRVVLMYGMGMITTLKQMVQDVFPSATFKQVKAVKMKIPQHHITELEGTKFIITTQVPSLRHGRVETGFDWEEFGNSLTQ